MKHKDFEDYLMDYFAMNDGRCVLDDDMPDAFDKWVCEIEVDDWLKYGDMYAKTLTKGAQNEPQS